MAILPFLIFVLFTFSFYIAYRLAMDAIYPGTTTSHDFIRPQFFYPLELFPHSGDAAGTFFSQSWSSLLTPLGQVPASGVCWVTKYNLKDTQCMLSRAFPQGSTRAYHHFLPCPSFWVSGMTPSCFFCFSSPSCSLKGIPGNARPSKSNQILIIHGSANMQLPWPDNTERKRKRFRDALPIAQSTMNHPWLLRLIPHTRRAVTSRGTCHLNFSPTHPWVSILTTRTLLHN